MGSHVTDTIRKGIADYKCFEDDPELLMYGCMWVILAVGLWLFLASYLEMPVSTTHSCVGGMIGMTMTIKGSDCVIWYAEKSTFPYVGGVSGIVLSWFISPIMSAIISGLLYFITRHFVLRRKDSFRRTFMSMPIFVGLTLTLNTFFIIYKGAKGIGLHKTELWVALVSAFGGGLLIGLIMWPLLPYIKRGILKRIEKEKERQRHLSDAVFESGNLFYWTSLTALIVGAVLQREILERRHNTGPEYLAMELAYPQGIRRGFISLVAFFLAITWTADGGQHDFIIGCTWFIGFWAMYGVYRTVRSAKTEPTVHDVM